MINCKVTVTLEDGTVNEWEQIYHSTSEAQMDGLEKGGFLGRVVVEPLSNAMTRDDKIMILAQDAVFYRNDKGFWRVQSVDVEDGVFQIVDENTGEAEEVQVENVKDTDGFYRSTEVLVSAL
jgi:hypothetical protein